MNLRFITGSRSRSVRDVGIMPAPGCLVAERLGRRPDRTLRVGCAVTATEATGSNPSGVRESNRADRPSRLRLANPQGLKRFIWLVLLIVSSLPIWSQAIVLKESSIKEGDQISTISEITLSFDFTQAAASTGVDEAQLGMGSALKDKTAYRALVYKGSKDSDYIGINQTITEDFIVGSGFYTIAKTAVVAGNHSITIPLSQSVTLEPGEHYTIYIPKGKLMAGEPGTLYTATATTEPVIIEVVGASTSANELKLTSSEPAAGEEIETLSDITLVFNQNVKVNDVDDIIISCYGDIYAHAVEVSANENIVTVHFDNIKLLNGKDYIVTIPANTIESIDDETKLMGAISLFYKGAAYQYMNTGRISPSTNTSVSYFSTVSIPFVFPEGYNLGHVEDLSIGLYEGSLESERIPLSLGETSGDMKTLNVELWKFDLKPSTTYYVVLDKEQIFPARSDDYRIKLKDTTNDEVILAYTTPAELELPAKVSVVVEPMEGADNDRLDTVTLNLADYEFEYNNYPVQPAIENPVAIFNDGTNDTQLPLTFNAGEKKATCVVNRSLEEGKTYTLKVPAGTFAPMAHANLAAVTANDDLVYTFIGKETPAAEFVSLSYTVDGEVTLKTMVEKGKPVTVAVTAPEGRQIESVTLDGTPLSGEMDVYTIPALAEDAGVLVTLVPVVQPDPVYHNVTLSLDNAVAQTSTVEEGRTVSFALTPADDLWTVESVSNATLDAETGMYVTEPVNADIEVKAVFALVNPVDFDFTVGVEGVTAECSYRVYSEGERLVIEGVTAGDNIRIYTTGGTLMADKSVPSDVNTVSMHLANGIYIVAINGKTLKVQH